MAAQTRTRCWWRHRSPPHQTFGGRRLKCCRSPVATKSAPVPWPGSLLPLLEDSEDRKDSADPEVDPVALADAMWTRRSHHNHRFAVPFGDRDELRSRLAAVADGSVAGGRTITTGTAPVFVFSGMGPQWWRMARDLLDADGPFAEAATELDKAFADLTGWSIIDELRRDESESRVTSTEIAQPANFLVQVGLTAELAHYGVRPGAVVGHSVGEVTAAYVSGMLSLQDAVKVSYHRSRLQATTAGTGGMLAVGLSEEEVQEWIAGRQDISVAAVNSPSGVTLAGTQSAIAEVSDDLADEGAFVRQLRVEVPYHSHLMDPILPAMRRELADLAPRKPIVPLYSTVTAAEVTGPDWGAGYWPDNVRQPVRFADTISSLIEAGERVFLEVGPHPVLSGNIKEILLRTGVTGTSIGTLNRDAEDQSSIRTALADLYVAGVLDTHRAPGGSGGLAPHGPLPVHQFQRQRLWSIEQAADDRQLGTSDALALPGDPVDARQSEWRTELADRPTALAARSRRRRRGGVARDCLCRCRARRGGTDHPSADHSAGRCAVRHSAGGGGQPGADPRPERRFVQRAVHDQLADQSERQLDRTRDRAHRGGHVPADAEPARVGHRDDCHRR